MVKNHKIQFSRILKPKKILFPSFCSGFGLKHKTKPKTAFFSCSDVWLGSELILDIFWVDFTPKWPLFYGPKITQTLHMWSSFRHSSFLLIFIYVIEWASLYNILNIQDVLFCLPFFLWYCSFWSFRPFRNPTYKRL